MVDQSLLPVSCSSQDCCLGRRLGSRTTKRFSRRTRFVDNLHTLLSINKVEASMSETQIFVLRNSFWQNFAAKFLAKFCYVQNHSIALSKTQFFFLQNFLLQNFAIKILPKFCNSQNFAHACILLTDLYFSTG